MTRYFWKSKGWIFVLFIGKLLGNKSYVAYCRISFPFFNYLQFSIFSFLPIFCIKNILKKTQTKLKSCNIWIEAATFLVILQFEWWKSVCKHVWNSALNIKKKGVKTHLKFERGDTVPLPRYSFGTIIAVLVRILIFCFQNFKEKILENNASQKS